MSATWKAVFRSSASRRSRHCSDAVEQLFGAHKCRHRPANAAEALCWAERKTSPSRDKALPKFASQSRVALASMALKYGLLARPATYDDLQHLRSRCLLLQSLVQPVL